MNGYTLGPVFRAWKPLSAGRRPALRNQPRLSLAPWRWLAAGFGWSWRIGIGAVLCFNFFLVSFLTSVVAAGWIYRWMRALVLRGWCRQFKMEVGWGRVLTRPVPAAWPCWFLQENAFKTLGGKTEVSRFVILRAIRIPWDSLWLNFKTGIKGLTGTFVLTAAGCLLMLFSWEFGWLNSFHKGHEVKLAGLATGWLGMLLFALVMVYVPLAQVHFAVTRDFQAFFDFRFINKLIRARLGANLGLAILALMLSLVLEILKTLPAFFDQEFPWAFREIFRHYLGITIPDCMDPLFPGLMERPDAEIHRLLQRYLLGCSLVLFMALLVVRGVAACIYRSAVLQGLRTGLLARHELHPSLAPWFEEWPGLQPQQPALPGAWGIVRNGARRIRRLAMFLLLATTWFLFGAKVYVSEFFSYHPVIGFMNHLLVHFPCFDFVPAGLAGFPYP
jgi:hypothetical protein